MLSNMHVYFSFSAMHIWKSGFRVANNIVTEKMLDNEGGLHLILLGLNGA